MGVSACLLGEHVRYDGKHKQQSGIVDQLATAVELISFCPEVGAGLNVPRPAVRLVSIGSDIFMRGVADPRLDVTVAVIDWIQTTIPGLDDLDGFILKARSPSCGKGSTPVFNLNSGQVMKGSGMFAAALQQAYPDMLIVEEDDLQTAREIKEFLSLLSH